MEKQHIYVGSVVFDSRCNDWDTLIYPKLKKKLNKTNKL